MSPPASQPASEQARPRFSVIVVTYQRPAALGVTLGALLDQTVGREAMEICVVDNGGAAPVAQVWRGRVDRWLEPGENLGPGGGRNLGVADTTAPIIVFVDDDGVPEPDFVEQLGAALDRHDDAVAVRGRVIAHRHPILTTMAVHYDRGPNEQEDLLTLEGATAVRRRAWEASGGYDPSWRTHEGICLSLRLLDTRPGATIMYTPHAVMRHDFCKGIGQVLDKAKRLASGRNQVLDSQPRLQQLVKKAGRYRQFDGRPLWAKVVGSLLERGFNGAIFVYRQRARWRQARPNG